MFAVNFLFFDSPLTGVCVWLALVALVCVGLWCFGVNLVLVCKFLVLVLVLLWFGLPPSKQISVNC